MAWGWSRFSLKTYSAHAAGRHDPEGSSAHGRGTRCFAYPCVEACATYNAHAAAQGLAIRVSLLLLVLLIIVVGRKMSPSKTFAGSLVHEHGKQCQRANFGASVIDTLANLKIRFDSVKRMTQIQNSS